MRVPFAILLAILIIALFAGANVTQITALFLAAIVIFYPKQEHFPHENGLLKHSGSGNNDAIRLKINNDRYPDIIFRTTKESAGGVTVSSPEQHLYAAAIMKIHHNTNDTRNNRELDMLVGNAPATPIGEPGEYKLLIKDKNVFHGRDKKINAPQQDYYVRIYRQIKPIDFKSPKDPKNYDIEQIADAHNLQSIGELSYKL